MKKTKIVCPECKHEFSPDLKHQLEHLLKEEPTGLIASFSENETTLNQEKAELNRKSRVKEIKTIL